MESGSVNFCFNRSNADFSITVDPFAEEPGEHTKLRVHLSTDKLAASEGIVEEVEVVDLNYREFRKLGRELRELFEQLQCSDKNNLSSPPSLWDDKRYWLSQIKEIALKGKYAFSRIFGHKSLQDFFNKISSNKDIKTVRVYSEHLVFPWELLFLDDPLLPNIKLDDVAQENYNKVFDNFLGYKWVVERDNIQDEYGEELIWGESFRLGIISYDKLKGYKKEYALLKKAVEKFKGIQYIDKLPSLNSTYRSEELVKFYEYMTVKVHNIKHFSCHASFISDRPGESNLTVSTEYQVYISDLKQDNFILSDGTAIVFNACEGGRIDAAGSDSFADCFLKAGAKCVLATECRVNSQFAVKVAERFYNGLAQGLSFSASLYQARQDLLDQGYIGGLAYSLYGQNYSPVINTLN